jgi:hypothetical protein
VSPVAQISWVTMAESMLVPGLPHGLPFTPGRWMFFGSEVSLPETSPLLRDPPPALAAPPGPAGRPRPPLLPLRQGQLPALDAVAAT